MQCAIALLLALALAPTNARWHTILICVMVMRYLADLLYGSYVGAMQLLALFLFHLMFYFI